MDRPVRTEAEQQEFFQACYERFLKAKASSGEISYFYRIGETNIRLIFAGKNLVPHLVPALEHLRAKECESPDATFCIWDSESTATEMIPPPCNWDCFTDRGDIWGFNSSRIKTAFHWIECSVNLMDLETNTGIFWVQTAKTLPYWVHASPLRTLFHWWMEKNGCQLLHAAAVGTQHGAVLITGKGGVGKSTAALSCLLSCHYYLADDYVVVCLEPEPLVYSIYCTAKLDADHLNNFPELSRFVKNPGKLDKEKAVMFLHPQRENQIVPKMPLKAILTPHIVHQDETFMVPIQQLATIQRAMSFTTMSQLPYVGRHTESFINKLSTLLPSYNLELGKDLKKIPNTISDFLSWSPAQRDFHLTSPLTPIPGIKPLISVIIPVYNGERFISSAIENILAQNYPALEIIVVNDGSTDKSDEIIEQLTVDIRYFKQNNAGPASARNRGIRDASGEFIVFLDVDDLWPENNLNMLVEEMVSDPDMDVIRGYAQLMEFNATTGEYDFVGNPKESFPHYIGAAIYRKSAFRKVGLFDSTLRFGEDKDWFIRAAELQMNIKRLEYVTLYVRRHGNNMTFGKTLIELNTLRVFKNALDRMRAEADGFRD